MSSLISAAASCHSAALPVLAHHRGQPGAPVDRNPAHDLGRREVPQLPAHLPDPGVGLAPVLERLAHLLLQDRPDPVVEVVDGSGVQVHRVEQGAPHVVLLLGVGGVPDPHRTGVRVARQMVQLGLLELVLPTDAVHDLQVVVLLGDVGDERVEVDRLPVEAEGVHPPQGERGVPNPGEAVVVVAVPARRLRKRGTAGRHDCARRGVGEPLQSQRTALQVAAPRVVGEPAAGQPVLPVVGRPHLLLVCVGVAGGRHGATPRQGDEPEVALLEQGAGAGLPAFEAQPHVGGEGERDVDALGARPALVVALAGVLPADVRAAVVEHRLAVHDGLHLAGHAADGAQQDVLGLVVVRGAAVGE